nr:immunoglobulin heavy chain junction region [Macaca mulatta]
CARVRGHYLVYFDMW